MDIPLSQIFENPAALRPVNRESVEFQELVTSIRAQGILNPILVRPNKGDNREQFPYVLVDGLHRFTGASEAGLTSIPALVKELTDLEALESQIVTNVQKIDTAPVQFTKGLQRIIAANPLMTKSELANKLGKSSAWLEQRLNLTKLVEVIGQAVDEGKVALSAAYALAKLPEEVQIEQLQNAMSMQTDEFIAHAAKLKTEIDKASREGRKAQLDVFEPTAHMRKFGEVRDLATGSSTEIARKLAPRYAIDSLTTKPEAFEAGFKAALEWTVNLDPLSVEEAKAKFDQKQAERIKKREDAANERLEKNRLKAKFDADRVELEYKLTKIDGKSPEEVKAALEAFDAANKPVPA